MNDPRPPVPGRAFIFGTFLLGMYAGAYLARQSMKNRMISKIRTAEREYSAEDYNAVRKFVVDALGTSLL